MGLLDKMLQDAKSAVILGHIHPDGDCVGSCLGLYNYMLKEFPQVQTSVYLESFPEKFRYLQNFEAICSDSSEDREFDVCFCLDSGDKGRLGEFLKYFDSSKSTVCIDHHITNTGYGAENVLEVTASSTCEVLYGLMEEDKVGKPVAECIYTGIVHDTGVFQYGNTSSETMIIAGKLMDKGIDFSTIITDSFYKKSYVQNQILGRALLESVTFLHGKCIFSVIRKRDMDFYEVTSKDMDGVVEQLRVTEGVECAIFMYEVGNQEFKVSMRSNKIVDVSKIAAYFGGGGHIRAAGCAMSGSIHDVINNLSLHIEKQMD